MYAHTHTHTQLQIKNRSLKKTQLGAVKGGQFPEAKYPHTILV